MFRSLKFMANLILATCILISLTLTAQGQGPFGPPPTAAMDTLNGGSVTGGAMPSYQDRFKQVKGSVSGNKPANSFEPGAMGSEFGGGPVGPGGPGGPGGRPSGVPNQNYAASVPNSVPTPVPTPKTIRVLSGKRVVGAVTGVLLEDTVFKEVPETDRDKYYDDGTHGDAVPDDGTYTNIQIVRNVMGPDAHDILKKTLTMLEDIESMQPVDFFRMNVVTSDPLSSIPNQLDLERNRDVKLREWDDRFLRMFRVMENDPTSEFYPLYTPSTPEQPGIALPPGFEPIIPATATPVNSGKGGQMGDIGGGSQYFDESKMGEI